MDMCQTPGYAIGPLIPYIERFGKSGPIWEPCAGEGYLVSAMSQYCRVVSGDVLTGQDFFDDSNVPDHYSAQITNPPFSLKYQWLKRSYELDKPFALLMPVDVFGAAKAQRLFEKYGVQVILLSPRVDFKMPNKGWSGGGSHFSTAWFTYKFDLSQQLNYAVLKKAQVQ